MSDKRGATVGYPSGQEVRMIDLYTWQTSNGQRAAIMLEECGFPYRVNKIDLLKNEQQSPEYLKINPAGQIPAIVDPDGPDGRPLTLTQSAAIALYLAEKSGRLIPSDPVRRMLALQWFMFTLADMAPASANLFLLGVLAPEKSTANLEWLGTRMFRFFRLADERLANREWLADELSIADFALYPVVAVRKPQLDANGGLANLQRWRAAIAERPTVAKAMAA